MKNPPRNRFPDQAIFKSLAIRHLEFNARGGEVLGSFSLVKAWFEMGLVTDMPAPPTAHEIRQQRLREDLKFYEELIERIKAELR
jgi:hypothetical protein